MTDPIVDPEAWETMKAITDPAFMIELIDVYLSDSPDLIDQMQRGFAASDIDVVRRAAHSLKSNSASFGANRLADACRDLEMLAKGNTLQGADPLIARVAAEYEALAPFLMEQKNEFE